MMVRKSDVKHVKLHSGVLEEEITELRWPCMRHVIPITGLQTGVELHRYAVGVG